MPTTDEHLKLPDKLEIAWTVTFSVLIDQSVPDTG